MTPPEAIPSLLFCGTNWIEPLGIGCPSNVTDPEIGSRGRPSPVPHPDRLQAVAAAIPIDNETTRRGLMVDPLALARPRRPPDGHPDARMACSVGIAADDFISVGRAEGLPD